MLASFGRFGDTEMVHMSMPEVDAIESQVGELPRNPVTGAKEAWLVPALAAVGSGLMAERSANAEAQAAVERSNANRQIGAADDWKSLVANMSNMSSAMPTYLRGADIAGPQATGMGAYYSGAMGDQARALSDQMAANAAKANQAQNEITAWMSLDENKQPPTHITIPGKSGIFGFGGRKARTIVNPAYEDWTARVNAYIKPRQAQIMNLQYENMNLGYQKGVAERDELARVSDAYASQIAAGRERLGDVFTGEHLNRQMAATQEGRDFRVRQAEAMNQAARAGHERIRNQYEAQENARRGGRGGDSSADRIARAKMAEGLMSAEAGRRLAAEGANIEERKLLNMSDIDRQLNMRAEPFRQLGYELSARTAPETAMSNIENQRQGQLAGLKVGMSNWMPMRQAPVPEVPSPQAIGGKALAGTIGQLGALYTGQQNVKAQNKALEDAHERNLELINAQGAWGAYGQGRSPYLMPGGPPEYGIGDENSPTDLYNYWQTK
tara:strand:+ start:3955 stop:5445 length:1491 start_codon:yes stop_codon:yes gene_type:complete